MHRSQTCCVGDEFESRRVGSTPIHGSDSKLVRCTRTRIIACLAELVISIATTTKGWADMHTCHERFEETLITEQVRAGTVPTTALS
jgi:hypothetical protein